MSSAPQIPVPSQHNPTPPPSWADLLGCVPSPKAIVEHLDRHVVGQQAAKKKLAVAVANNFKRLVDCERWGGRMTGIDPIADAKAARSALRAACAAARPAASPRRISVGSMRTEPNATCEADRHTGTSRFSASSRFGVSDR